MTIEKFIKKLQSYKNQDCYEKWIYCENSKIIYTIEAFNILNNTCFIWLNDSDDCKTNYTPKSLVRDLSPYTKWQKDFIIEFVDDERNEVYTENSFYTEFDNLYINIK